MSGILGLLSRHTLTPNLKRGARALVQIPGGRPDFFSPCPGVALASVGKEGRIDSAQDNISNLLLLVQGTALSPVKPYRQLSAIEILKLYLNNGLKSFEDIEGSFVLVLVDQRQRKIHIVNDRLGQLPLLYATRLNWFCFGSQAKAIFPVTDLEPKLSSEGVVQFLAAGYPFGEQCMFEELYVLKPATQLSIGLDDLKVNSKQYWSLQYKPQRDISRKRAIAELYGAVIESHQITLGQDSFPYDLMLTGGWDSRGILEALVQVGSRPQTARSWGMQDDLEGSDPEIARRLARAFGVDFYFFQYDVERLPHTLRQWVCVSELMNDNLGWYIELPQCYGELHRSEAAFELIGDEVWGWQGHVHSEQDAVARVLPPTLPNSITNILRQGHRLELHKRYEEKIQAILSSCISREPNDLKDFAYFNIRVNRFIFSLGYFRELMVAQRRPFLTRPVLDVICQFPREMRTDKNGYISMLKAHMPNSAAFPTTSVSSVADWPYLFRTDKKICETFTHLLSSERISSGALGEVLSTDQLLKVRDRFFSAKPYKRSKENLLKARLRTYARKVIERTPGVRDIASLKRENNVSDFDILRRVALCAALQEELPRFKVGLPELLLFENSPEPTT